MLKKLSIAAMLAVAIGIVPMVGHASVPPEGCVAGYDDGYTASEKGGFIIAGDGIVTVKRGQADPVSYNADNSPALFDDGKIIAGDVVTCSATNGLAIAGNPLP